MITMQEELKVKLLLITYRYNLNKENMMINI
jgi:hypothetical protein